MFNQNKNQNYNPNIAFFFKQKRGCLFETASSLESLLFFSYSTVVGKIKQKIPFKANLPLCLKREAFLKMRY
jgi:hypothetical protein